MVCFALGVAMKTTLRNHIFRFHDQIRKQQNGGAIGVKAAGDIAGLFMVWWDREFKARVREEEIDMKMYTRYVDDETVVCKAIPGGPEDIGKEPDELTMNKLKEIGNSIHPSIQLTVDFPSNNVNKRVPILDTEHWIQEVDVDGEVKPQIIFSHYSKPMANKQVIHRQSAHPFKTKINILVADLVRTMRNISSHCTTEERKKKLQFFLNRMQFSGYSKKERHLVYTKAEKRYKSMIEKMEQGVQPLYRSKEWNRDERQRNKAKKKSCWFKNGDGAEAVMFVDTTPNRRLATLCEDVFKSQGIKVKVIERTSNTIKRCLVKSNPFKKKGCQKDSCDLCNTGSDINCKARGTVYKISCTGENNEGNQCEGVEYIGESSRSVAERFAEHAKMIRSENEQTRKRSFLHDHIESTHGGQVPSLEVKILGTCPDDPSMRQALEAVFIRKEDPILNRKQEWTNEPRQRRDKQNK